ncbi:GNAT family N-acetyltransferase [Kaistia dalseonensis]|uniref:GNAT superfamily N-acetyltransferase n=1 Tax=Kaistia dalseonensis TaxID=410840 RepID=A0ABU0H581_9HYPH|nr:GNAT family N-acetyltransferase [Kaistia dalseonensis]MCX5494334.1 GNAT family N-acetyltransferase [Kaistia dalseonensis]MDQ0436915.1 GNAT superfamily N-acetyltransferase [Kaistia dalseonensis]
MTDADRLWTALQRHTLDQTAALSAMIAERADLASDGRYIYLFEEAGAAPDAAAVVIRQFGRAMIYLPQAEASKRAGQLVEGGFEVKAGLSALSGGAPDVLGRSEALMRSFASPTGLTLAPLDGAGEQDVVEIQQLQFKGGLVPMPQDAIVDPASCGIVIRDAKHRIVGFASLLPLEAHGRRRGWYQLNGVAIDGAYRGRGLGAAISASTVMLSTRRGRPTHFISSIEDGNQPSMKMQIACGLRPDVEHSYLFARISREEEARLLAPVPR